MNEKFDSQKETLVSLNHEINLLQQQVRYLLRNGKAAELLDLDVLMNRTHTIYDMICSINISENEEEQDFDIDPEALTALFGSMIEDEDEQTGGSTEETIATNTEETLEEAEAPDTIDTQEETSTIEAMPADEDEPETAEITAIEEETVMGEPPVEEEQPAAEEPTQHDDAFRISVEEQLEHDEQPREGDDFGYFFRFEDIPLKDDDHKENSSSIEERQEERTDIVEEINGKTVHFMEAIPETDHIEADDLVQDDPFKMPTMDDAPAQYGGYFENDDTGFEINSSETLGEHLIDDDKSLNAKYQHAPVRDLKSAIGLNDKFLFVNELFGGSMERFNKAIENLNDMMTANGAMIYLNELKIELQWNSSNEAYKKLWTLVAQKFEE